MAITVTRLRPTARISSALAAAALSTGVRYSVTASAVADSLPFSDMRPKGNLAPDPKFAWGRADRNNGFMYLYSGKMRGRGPFRFPFLGVLAQLAAQYAPEYEHQAPSTQVFRTAQPQLKEMLRVMTGQAIHDMTRVKREEEFYVLDIPVSVNATAALRLAMRLASSEIDGPRLEALSAALVKICGGANSDPTIPQSRLPSGLSVQIDGTKFTTMMSPKTRTAFQQLERPAEIIVDDQVIYVRFYASIATCQKLCQASWHMVRPADMYALANLWAKSRLGENKTHNPPVSSRALATIAASRPAQGTPRVNDLKLAVDTDAKIWYIQDADNISGFDTAWSQFLEREDGSFSAAPLPGSSPKPAPENQLVFVDWLNLKMAYSNTHGFLDIMDLSLVQPAKPTHVKRFLDTKLGTDEAIGLLSKVPRAAIALGLPPMSTGYGEGFVQSLLLTAIRDYGEDGLTAADLTIGDLYKYSNPQTLELTLLIAKLHDALIGTNADQNIQVLYGRYSVVTAQQMIAAIIMMAHFGPRYADLTATVNNDTAIYRDQGQSPTFEVESVPFISDGRFVMPHQKRVLNMLRDSPAFAVLDCAAGSGKTTMGVIDVLTNMKKGKVKRALIMCPSHLVSQYVEEFTYFTSGRLNVLAINTYTIKKHGIEGLQRLLQAAPPNTVVVTDYNLANSNTKRQIVGYGTAKTTNYALVEFLRQFSFDYVFCDESHILKGSTSTQQGVARLLAEIPMKRLASGTLTPNSVVDLVKQVQLFDPGIFGSENDFRAKYAEDPHAPKITWKKGFETDVMAQLRKNVVFASAKRKEWAAILPQLKEEGHAVTLTPNQQSIYNSILKQAIEGLQEAMKDTTNETLRKALGLAPLTEAGDEQENDPDKDDVESDGEINLDKILQPHLARLESFVTAPSKDKALGATLTGEDAISPKVLKIAEICRDHIAKGIDGKIIIFCNYSASALAIYEGLGELMASTVYYTASNKAECVAKFSNDPKFMIMVGVEKSMNTGLNLQMASRLIRADSVWTPGSLEQGNSRILRPNVKVAEMRDQVFIDWVLAEGTIDLTKSAYLMAKRIQIEKFENAGNPLYDNVDAPPLFKLDLATLAASSNSDSDMLQPYFDGYSQISTARGKDYADYRDRNQADLDVTTLPDGRKIFSMKKHTLTRAPNLPNSKLMYRVPYVPGTNLYAAKDCGLQRYDEYLRLSAEEVQSLEDSAASESEGDDDDVSNADSVERNKIAEEREALKGLYAHTEYGDGEIVGLSKKSVTVKLSDGSKVKIHKLSCYIVNRAQTTNRDMRDLLLQQVGDVDYQVPVELQAKDPAEVKVPPVITEKVKKEREAVVDTRIPVKLDILMVNGVLGLQATITKSRPELGQILEAVGFRQPAPFLLTSIKTPQSYLRLFKAWNKASFAIHEGYVDSCRMFYEAMMQFGVAKADDLYQVYTSAQLTNFFREQHRSQARTDLLLPSPMVLNDNLYLALPASGHPASMLATKVKVPTINWQSVPVALVRQSFFLKVSEMSKKIKELLSIPDLLVVNEADLYTQIKELRAQRKEARTQRREQRQQRTVKPEAPAQAPAEKAVFYVALMQGTKLVGYYVNDESPLTKSSRKATKYATKKAASADARIGNDTWDVPPGSKFQVVTL